jgi:hypothetical protein
MQKKTGRVAQEVEHEALNLNPRCAKKKNQWQETREERRVRPGYQVPYPCQGVPRSSPWCPLHLSSASHTAILSPYLKDLILTLPWQLRKLMKPGVPNLAAFPVPAPVFKNHPSVRVFSNYPGWVTTCFPTAKWCRWDEKPSVFFLY